METSNKKNFETSLWVFTSGFILWILLSATLILFSESGWNELIIFSFFIFFIASLSAISIGRLIFGVINKKSICLLNKKKLAFYALIIAIFQFVLIILPLGHCDGDCFYSKIFNFPINLNLVSNVYSGIDMLLLLFYFLVLLIFIFSPKFSNTNRKITSLEKGAMILFIILYVGILSYYISGFFDTGYIRLP